MIDKYLYGLISDVIHPDDEMFLWFLNKGHVNQKAKSIYMDSGKSMLKDFVGITDLLDFDIRNLQMNSL